MNSLISIRSAPSTPPFMTLNDLSRQVRYGDTFLQVKTQLQPEAHLLLQRSKEGTSKTFKLYILHDSLDERHLEALGQKQKASTPPRRSGGLFG